MPETSPNVSTSPQQSRPVRAVTALALMYANGTPVPVATELLFAVGDCNSNFMRADIIPAEAPPTERHYTRLGLDAMAAVGLVEYTGEVRGRGNGRCLRRAGTLPMVSADYNEVYASLLSEFSGLDRETISDRSSGVLRAAFFGVGTPLPKGAKSSVAAVVATTNMSQEHATQRMLTGYARVIGFDIPVRKELEKRVINHPRSKRS